MKSQVEIEQRLHAFCTAADELEKGGVPYLAQRYRLRADVLRWVLERVEPCPY